MSKKELFDGLFTDNKKVVFSDCGAVTETSLEAFLEGLDMYADDECLSADFIGVVM